MLKRHKSKPQIYVFYFCFIVSQFSGNVIMGPKHLANVPSHSYIIFFLDAINFAMLFLFEYSLTSHGMVLVYFNVRHLKSLPHQRVTVIIYFPLLFAYLILNEDHFSRCFRDVRLESKRSKKLIDSCLILYSRI